MSSPVLSEIERQKKAEQIKSWDAAEKAMAERLIKKFGQPEILDVPEELQLRTDYINWCAERGVRNCPARPGTVATFILDYCRTHDQMLDALAVISRMHDRHNLNSPCATALVRLVLATVMDDKPPRSWTNADKQEWAFLPADLRGVISRRESIAKQNFPECELN